MNLTKKIGATVAAATLAAAAAFIVPWEVDRKAPGKPYLDVGGVATACAGVTKNIDFSHIYTDAECADMNSFEIQAHAERVLACVKREISEKEKTPLISIGYNVGTDAICKSTLMRKLNAGEPYCDEYLKWNKVNGVPVRGLTNRRVAERALCLEGIKS